MSGIKRVSVRKDYSEETVWREALGNSEPLLVYSAMEATLDAPDFIASGSTVADSYVTAMARKVSREDQTFNYM